MILRLENVSKSYKKNNIHFNVLENINFQVKKGELLGLVGESGCGKSTLAKLISKFDDDYIGSIKFYNQSIKEIKKNEVDEYYRRVQIVFQNPLATFSPRMKIKNYLKEPFINFSILNKSKINKHLEDLVCKVGLNPSCLNKYPNELSGGELQRITITRALGINPELIIFDEITSNLDVIIQSQIIQLLKELRDEYLFTGIFITHDLILAENICDRILVMKDGKIIEILEGENKFKSAKEEYTKNFFLASNLFTI